MTNIINLKTPNALLDVSFYLHEQQWIIPPMVYPPHVADSLEFYILIDGNSSFSVENNLYKLSIGDIIVAKPNQVHNCILNSTSVHKHLCFWFNPSSSFIFDKFLNIKSNLISPPTDEKERLLDIYTELRIASENGDEFKQYSLIISMIEIIRRYADVDSPEQTAPPVLKEILDDLNSSFKEINSLSYFTTKYSMSPSTLNRLFKEHLNTSPKLYLETKRLAYARILLKRGKSVLEACMEAGFPDYSNFIRTFKKRFKVTPNQYKNNEE
ncbi:MAG: helix-turn-helix domain-containing protein [Clostridia bacterium]|nr:helix-turn-helix domain-containing protein [Clostridia bacterium]